LDPRNPKTFELPGAREAAGENPRTACMPARRAAVAGQAETGGAPPAPTPSICAPGAAGKPQPGSACASGDTAAELTLLLKLALVTAVVWALAVCMGASLYTGLLGCSENQGPRRCCGHKSKPRRTILKLTAF
jgi:hypothetical protein